MDFRDLCSSPPAKQVFSWTLHDVSLGLATSLMTSWCYSVLSYLITIMEQFCGFCYSIYVPVLGPQGGWPSWRAPHGCTHQGSETSQTHTPAHGVGMWWMWCGFACAFSSVAPYPTALENSRHSQPFSTPLFAQTYMCQKMFQVLQNPQQQTHIQHEEDIIYREMWHSYYTLLISSKGNTCNISYV